MVDVDLSIWLSTVQAGLQTTVNTAASREASGRTIKETAAVAAEIANKQSRGLPIWPLDSIGAWQPVIVDMKTRPPAMPACNVYVE